MRSSTLIFLGIFLLLVARNEVHARNYLLWALGLEDSNEGSRRLLNRHDNQKTRIRIAGTRKARRQGRKDTAAAADAEAATVRSGGGGNYLREKVAEKLEGGRQKADENEKAKDAGQRVKVEGGGGKAKQENAHEQVAERRYEKKLLNHKKHKKEVAAAADRKIGSGSGGGMTLIIGDGDKAAARIEKVDHAAAVKDTPGGGTALRGGEEPGVLMDVKIGRGADGARNDVGGGGKQGEKIDKAADTKDMARAGKQELNAHAREKENHYERKVENKKKHQEELAAAATDRTFGAGGAGGGRKKNVLARSGRGGDKPAGRAAYTKDKARAGKHGLNAHAREKESHYERKVDNKKKHKEEVAASGGKPGNHGLNAHAREKESHYERKVENKKKHKEEVAAKHKEEAVARSGATSQQNHKHKRGFNKRKQEKIAKEHAKHNRKAPIEQVTLRDGGVGRRGPT